MARGGGSYFYHVDHLGSVRLLTDGAGAIVSRYDYDAFGNLEPTSFEGVANPYGFTARERDAESGLMFYRARYYDPELGRFISQDPIGFEGGDLNLYRYVVNKPIQLLDPTGRSASIEGGLLGCASGLIVGTIGYELANIKYGMPKDDLWQYYMAAHLLLATGAGCAAGAGAATTGSAVAAGIVMGAGLLAYAGGWVGLALSHMKEDTY